MPDIFVSYARADQERITPLVQRLRAARLEVWWDVDLHTGSTFREIINQQLQDARCVLVLWSRASIASKWVLDEAEYASKFSTILPLTIDDVEPPIGFRQFHSLKINLNNINKSQSKSAFSNFIKEIKTLLADPQPSKSSRPRDRKLAPKRDSQRPRFSARVVSLYEALGFRVTSNRIVNQHAFDLVATRHVPGSGIVNVGINIISDQEQALGKLMHFLSNATQNIHNASITQFVVVSAKPPSSAMQKAALTSPQIRLTSLAELENELFSVTDSLVKIIRDYQESSIFRNYVPIAGTGLNSRRSFNDLGRAILDELRRQSGVVILFGDFGSGKTTIMERLVYELAINRTEDTTSPTPLFLRLRGLRQYPDLWSFVQSNLRDHLFIQPTRSAFFELLNSGRLVVLMDGFDEIHTGASIKERAEYLGKLLPLIVSPSSCVLASRPTYFESMNELLATLRQQLLVNVVTENIPQQFDVFSALSAQYGIPQRGNVRAADFCRTITIEGLSQASVLQYLENRRTELQAATGKGPADVLRSLSKIYDLNDLMSRPLLLEMITETLVKKVLTLDTQSIGPAMLYQNYTQLALHRDTTKQGGQILTAAERAAACRLLALRMLENGSIELSGADVEAALLELDIANRSGKFESSISEQLEHIKTEIRVCSFLSFSQDGGFRFAHKSYFEFFIAQAFWMNVTQPELRKRISNRGLGREIIYFLGSYARDLGFFQTWVVSELLDEHADPSGLLYNVALRAAFAAGVPLNNREIFKAIVADVDVIRTETVGVKLSELEFRNFSVRETSFKQCEFSKCSLINSSVRETQFDGGSLEAVLSDSVFLGCEHTNQLIHLDGARWEIDRAKMKKCTIVFGGSGIMSDLSINDCTVEFRHWGGRLHRELRCARSVLFGDPLGAWFSMRQRIVLSDCFICGLMISSSEFDDLTQRARKAPREIIQITECAGLVLVDAPISDLSESERGYLRDQWPKIMFCERRAFLAKPQSYRRRMREELEAQEWYAEFSAKRKFNPFRALFRRPRGDSA